MKKQRFVSLLTAAAVSCTFLFSTAYADGEYINNFNKINAYTANQFSDIGSEWYAPSVQTVYEIGLMNGDSASTFNPSGNLSNAEAVAIAARLHSIYNTGADNFAESSPWYQVYMDYAVANGICSANFNPEDTANRSFFVGILGNAVDSSVLTQKNTIADGDLYDVDGWYSPAVYSFYRAGVLGGNDEYGTFAPDTPITRAEAAAVLVRLVKPSDRIDVVLQERPAGGTYSIMADDGSLEAYRQRALAANFEVLLGGKARTPEWESDVYTIEHREIKGTPSETIVIPRRYLDTRHDSTTGYYIVFKASHIDPSLSGEISIPLYYIQNNMSISPAGMGGRHYKLSVVNTGGRVDFSGGWLIQGDLQLYYPGEEGTTAWTETVTYDNYTAEAQNIINSISFTPQRIDENAVKTFINNTYGTNNQQLTMIGYLTDWNGEWYLTMNNDDMYRPEQRDTNKTNQTTYIFTPPNSEARTWCENNFGKYVIALVDFSMDSAGTPVMLAEINGYADTKDKAVIDSWSFDGSNLSIDYKTSDITFSNPLIIYDEDTVADMGDTTGLLPAILHPLAPENGSQLASHSYADMYRFDYNDSVTTYSDRYFHMTVENDQITLFDELSSTVLTLTLNSDTAVIGGRKISFDSWGDPIISSEILGGTIEIVIPPKKLNDQIYLPYEFVLSNLFNDGEDLNHAEIDLSGLAKVIDAPRRSDEYRCLEGYEENIFILGASGDEIYVSSKKSIDEDFKRITLNIGSVNASFTEYDRESKDYVTTDITVSTPPQKIYDEWYLPTEDIIRLLFSE